MSSATELLDLSDELRWAANDLPEEVAAACRRVADELARHGTAQIVAMMDATVERVLHGPMDEDDGA